MSKDMELTHLQAVLDLQYLGNKFKIVLEKELEFRKGAYDAKSI